MNELGNTKEMDKISEFMRQDGKDLPPWFKDTVFYYKDVESILDDLKESIDISPEVLQEMEVGEREEGREARVKEVQEKNEYYENDATEKMSEILETMDSKTFGELCEKYDLENRLTKILDELKSLEEIKDPEQRAAKEKEITQKIELFKGKVAEAVQKEALSDFFEILEDEKPVKSDNVNTKIDITCKNAKEDIHVGHVEVKKGEDLYVESKVGKADYIRGQMQDLIDNQLAGHHIAGKESQNDYKSVLIVSSDYYNVSEKKRNEFEAKLKEIGTELVVLDKSADDYSNQTNNGVKGMVS